MMARASRSIPQYTPSIYLPGSFGRYRQYPRVVRTSIPGAGVKAGKMIWGEQVMNLWGAPVARYSNNRVPLLGLGQDAAAAGRVTVDVFHRFTSDMTVSLAWLTLGVLLGHQFSPYMGDRFKIGNMRRNWRR
jgi:hypothetical protein